MGTKTHKDGCGIVGAAFLPAGVVVEFPSILVGFDTSEEGDDFVLASDAAEVSDVRIEDDFNILEVFQNSSSGGEDDCVLYGKVLCFDDDDLSAFVAAEEGGHEVSEFGIADVGLMWLYQTGLFT